MRLSSMLLPLILVAATEVVACQVQTKDPAVEQAPWTSFTTAANVEGFLIVDDTLWGAGGGLRGYDLQSGRLARFLSEGGLLSNSATSLAYDPTGQEIWIGTIDGAARYDLDNHEWELFRKEDGLAHSWVRSLAVSHYRGLTTIWFGTKGGLTRLTPATRAWKSFTATTGLKDDWVNSLAVDDPRGNLWVGTAQGVQRINLDSEELEEPSHLPGPAWVEDLAVDPLTGDLWAAAQNGLHHYQRLENRWDPILFQQQPLVARTLALAGSQPQLWVGTDHGLLAYDFSSEQGTWHQDGGLQGSAVTALLVQQPGETVWAGTDRGVFRREGQNPNWLQVIPPDGPVHNDVNSLVLDPATNKIWLVTNGGGVSGYDLEKETWQNFTKADGLFSVLFRSADFNNIDQSLWLGSEEGLEILWPKTGKVRRIKTDNGLDEKSNVVAVRIDEANSTAWVGVWGRSGGLYKFDTISNQLAFFDDQSGLPHNSVTSLALDGEDLWVGTGGGVTQYNRKLDTWRTFDTRDGLPNSAIITVALDNSRGTVWVATEGGVAALDKRTQLWQSFPKQPGGLAHTIILCIAVDEARDRVWFGTEGAGVSLYDLKNQKWTTFSSRDGLAGNYVLSAQIDPAKDCVWFGTLMGGASRFCLNER